MNVPRVLQMLRDELESVAIDDAENAIEGIDWHEAAVAEAWRNGYARAIQVVYEEYTRKCCE
jgi:hypothetical protein